MTLRDFLKPIMIILGMLLLIIGLIMFPLPIPIGALFIIIGLVILVSTSYTAVLVIRRIRQDHAQLDAWLRDLEKRSPKWLSRVLRRTDPVNK